MAGEKIRRLHIVDDGTLDTVVGCANCDWEGRYNPDCWCSDGGACEARGEDWRIDAALEMAAEDHKMCELREAGARCPNCGGRMASTTGIEMLLAFSSDVRQGVTTEAEETRIIDADDAAHGNWRYSCVRCRARLIVPIS
jgi:hypothetical protein